MEQQPQTLYEEILNCYGFYRRIFSKVIGWTVLLSVLPSFYIFLLSLLENGLGVTHGMAFVSFSIIGGFAVALVSAYLYCLILEISYQLITDQPYDLKKGKKKSRDRYVQAIAGAVVAIITIFTIPLLIRLVLLHDNAFLSVLAMGFGLFAFILLTTMLIIYLPLIILEERNFLQAIPESFNFVQNNLFRIFSLILFTWFLPLGLVHYVIHSIPDPTLAGRLWLILHSLMMPLVFAVMVMVYMDLKAHGQFARIDA